MEDIMLDMGFTEKETQDLHESCEAIRELIKGDNYQTPYEKLL